MLYLHEKIMHSKQKGNIAEATVVLDLKKLGYCVFSELGDLSKIDIIAEKDSQLLRFQVKGYTPNNEGSIYLSFSKSGPNYQFKYLSEMFDYFAVVNLDDGSVGYIPSTILDGERKHCIALRVRPTKNNQTTNTNYLKDFRLPV